MVLSKKGALALCVSASVLVWASSAWAEKPEAGASSAEGNVEELVVTARKRTEALQDVPMAVSAVGSAELERRGVKDVNDLYATVPGLFTAPGSVNNSADFAYLTMRGVGFNAGLEPAVGVFLDGMYLPQLGFDSAFLDLERVEVLRGPQGALFGRNTQGGAINLVTRKPAPETHGLLRAEAGSFKSFRAGAALSGQVGEGLYAGVSAEGSTTDGFIHNVVRGGRQDYSRQIAARGVLRWEVSERVEALLIGDATQRDYNEPIRGVRLANHRYESVVDQDRPDSKSNHGLQLNVTARLSDSVTLTSISGWRVSKSNVFTDMDSRITNQQAITLPAYAPYATTPQTVVGATLDLDLDQTFKSQELRLAGEGKRLSWLAGAYYFDQRQDQIRNRDVGAGVAYTLPAALYIREDYRDDRDGYAGFGQLSFRPAQNIELTAGARYSHEKVVGSGGRITVYGPPANSQQPLVRKARDSFSNVSWMASAAYKPAAGLMVYATFAEGWKAGGINRFPANVQGDLPYKDESSETYEVGAKTQLLDQRLGLNVAAYHIDIRNQQLTNVIPDPNGGPAPVTVIDNAASSHVDGFEAEARLRPAEGLELAGSLAYSKSEFDNFVRVLTPTDKHDFSGTPLSRPPRRRSPPDPRRKPPTCPGYAAGGRFWIGAWASCPCRSP